MSDVSGLLIILGAFAGLPCLLAYLFRNYVLPMEKRRQAEWRRLRESDPNAPMPPEPELPVWAKLLGGAIVIAYFGGLIIAYASALLFFMYFSSASPAVPRVVQ
jgi:hypothetical protein